MSLLTKSLGLAALLVAACSQAPVPTDNPDTLYGRHQVGFPAEVDGVEPLEGLVTGVLDNGMRYAIYRNNFPEDVIAIEMAIEVGSFDEEPGHFGMAHFLEHMVFNGSENIKEGEIDSVLGKSGLSIGGMVNASTDYDVTRYLFNLPSNKQDMLDTAFFVLSEMTGKAIFEDEAIDRERGIIHSEIRGRSGDGTVQEMQSQQFFFPKLLRTHRSPTGTTEDLNSVVQKDFVDFYERYYRPEHTTFTITGPVDPAAIEKSLNEYFGDWERGDAIAPLPDYGTVDEKRAGETAEFYSPDISNSIAMRWVNKTDPAEAKQAPTLRDDLINGLVSTIFEQNYSSLQSDLQKKDDTLKIGSVNYTFLQNVDKTLDVLSIDIWPEDLEDGLANAVKYATAMRNHAASMTLSDEEFESLKSDFLSWQKSDRFLNDGWNTYDFTRIISTNILKGEAVQSRATIAARIEAELAGITQSDIKAAFEKHYAADRAPLVFIGMNEEINGLGDKVLDAWSEAEANWKTISADFPAAFSANEEQSAAPFDYSVSDVAGELESREYLDDIDVQKFAYKNGVKLNTTTKAFGSDNIDIQIRFGRGMLEPDYVNAAGMKEALESVFVNGGLENHSLTDLFTALPDLQRPPILQVEEDAFVLSNDVSAEKLEQQVKVMSAFIQSAAWREEAFEQFQESRLNIDDSTYAGLPELIYSQELNTLVCPDDILCKSPTEEDYAALKLEDVKTSITRALERGHIEISVIGNIEADKVQKIIAENFGNLPAREATPLAVTRERKFGAGQADPFTFKHTGDDNRAFVSIIWPAPDGIDAYQRRKLRIMREIFYGKIFRELREATGLTYSPSVDGKHSLVYKDFGYINVLADVKLDTISQASDVIFDVSKEMRRGEISAEEFFQTHSQYIEYAKGNKDNKAAMVELLTRLQGAPKVLEDYRSVVSDYERISREEIIALSREIFVDDKTRRMHITPQ